MEKFNPENRPIASAQQPRPDMTNFRVHYVKDTDGYKNDFYIQCISAEKAIELLTTMFPGRGSFQLIEE